MKNLLLSSVAVLCISGTAYGQSGTEMIEAIDGGIAMMNDREPIFTFESREVGADNSITFRNVHLGPEGDDVGFTTAWVKATPSAANPGSAIFTIADTVLMEIDEGDVPLTITLASNGLVLETNLINGMGPAPSFSISADAISVTGGDPAHEELRKLNFQADSFALGFNLDMITRNVDAAMKTGNLTLDVDAGDEDESIIMEVVYEGFDMTFTGQNIPLDEDMIKDFIDKDGSFQLIASAGPYKSVMKGASRDFPLSMSMEAGASAGEVSMIDGVFKYRAEFNDAHYLIEPDPSMIPLPAFNVSLSGGDFDIQVPLRPSANDQNVVFDMSIRDLAVDESLWAMVDPGGALSHDPANLEIDLGAIVRIDHALVESLDEDGVADLPIPFMVGQAKSVDITKVFLSVAGAVLDVNGQFDINNDGPIPMPLGKVNISLEGAQAIANHLVTMGVIQQTEVGMVMGMMMAFMKPGDEPDSFSTVIEVNENGVTANGAPLPF